MIIDIHAHTSIRELQGLHTVDASLEYLRQRAKEFGIGKIYLMATYFPLKKSGLANRSLLERIAEDPLFGCFGSLDLESNLFGGLEELDNLAESKLISGIKLYPGYQNVLLSDLRFRPVFQLAEKYHLPVACHLGELHHCCPKDSREKSQYRCGQNFCQLDQRGYLSRPYHLGKVARDFPNVNFIACHLANPFFAELRAVMTELQNVYTDISGQFLSGTSEDNPEYRLQLIAEITEFLRLDHGVERLLFGTDFPIQSYADTLSLVTALPLSSIDRQKVLSDNALKVLNLK